MLFYNLDTADLTGNEYTDSRLESWDAAFGERQGWSAGLCWPRTAPAGTTGLRRGVNRGGCAEYPEEEGQPRFLLFLPTLPLGLRCDARLVALVALVPVWGGLLCLGGSRGISTPPFATIQLWYPQLAELWCCHPPAPISPGRGGCWGCWGCCCDPSTEQSLRGTQGTWAAPAFPVLPAICARVVKGVN